MDMMATMYAAVDYEGKDIKELSTFNDKVLKPYLERQEGVASVTVNGAIEDTIEVRLDKKKIREVNKNILGETNEKLSDAQKKIDKGLRKVEDGKSELSKQEKNLSSKQDDTYSKLSKANVKLSHDANTTLLSRTLQKKLDDYKTPEGYTVEISGETEQVNDMMVQMGSALLLGFLLIYLIMVVQFKSLLSPFIIIFTVPLAFTGGMLGLMTFDMSISAMSMMGFMVLMGTVVNNGIVFVDYANQLRLKGAEKKTALIITGKTRMRPIIMTALTTILSMSVMAFSQDAGNAMQKGMAVVVCFGLLYATLMTLFIVPVLYDVFYRRPLRNIDIGKETENIPDETEAVLEEYGYTLDAAVTAEEHA